MAQMMQHPDNIAKLKRIRVHIYERFDSTKLQERYHYANLLMRIDRVLADAEVGICKSIRIVALYVKWSGVVKINFVMT